MRFPRASGILLHVTSLPGSFGIGELGSEACRFVDFLAASGQRLWQVLPLGPPSYGASPYQCSSAFAGNPLLISLEGLRKAGLLEPSDLQEAPSFPSHRVDYEKVTAFKLPLLRKAFARFQANASSGQRAEFVAFQHQNGWWLQDFSLFMAAREANRGAPWTAWEEELATRQPGALERWSRDLGQEVQAHQFLQFLFFQQWSGLRDYCHARGVRIVGDLPMFVAHDSADVWSHQELFLLDARGEPAVVAGVPPDYFSKTGQLWGNPLYRWDVMAQTGYAWWLDRLKATLALVDVLRLDHFRGFEMCWEVPAAERTAVNGRWVEGPGPRFLETLRATLGDLPIFAEDLGVITPEVHALREQFGFPGMRVLQFAFGGSADNSHLPHSYPQSCVVYTGTHDNDTTVGWFQSAGPGEQAFARKYLGTDGSLIHRDLIRLALGSVADTAITPLQDLLGLGSEARMNRPGTTKGNWEWQCSPGMLTNEIRDRLAGFTRTYGR